MLVNAKLGKKVDFTRCHRAVFIGGICQSRALGTASCEIKSRCSVRLVAQGLRQAGAAPTPGVFLRGALAGIRTKGSGGSQDLRAVAWPRKALGEVAARPLGCLLSGKSEIWPTALTVKKLEPESFRV